MLAWEVVFRPDGRPDGKALRRAWEALLDDAARTVERARRQAAATEPDYVTRWFRLQVTALRGLRSSTAARVHRPGEIGTGLLHEIPTQATQPEYDDAMTAIGHVTKLWSEGLHVPGWDWATNGYPPGWGISVGSVLANALVWPSAWRLRRRRRRPQPPPPRIV